MKTRTSWREKVNRITEAELVEIPEKMQLRFGRGRMLIPRPVDIEKLIGTIRKGKLITKSELRKKLAADAGAEVSCPLTTGIFLRMVSEAAEEDLVSGKKKIAPYWRVVGDKGELNEKIYGGSELQSKRLKAEGFEVVQKNRGGKLLVRDYEKMLMTL